MNRKLRIDYGDMRCGIAVSDLLGLTSQGLETINTQGSDKIILRKLDEILQKYPEVDTFVVGMPYNMDRSSSFRVEKTNQFIHKLKCKYPKMQIETVDERLTTVQSYKIMNELNVNKNKKRNIVDTLSAQLILESYLNKMKK